MVARAMGGESAHPFFGRRPVGGANGAWFCLPSELPGLGSLSNFAWCYRMVPTASPESSVGMLCGLFCIDVYALSCVGAIDVVVWQWEVDLSDSERCTLLPYGVY